MTYNCPRTTEGTPKKETAADDAFDISEGMLSCSQQTSL